MNYQQLLAFIGTRGGTLPKGRIHSGIPQSFKDEDERQWKLFFQMLDEQGILKQLLRGNNNDQKT